MRKPRGHRLKTTHRPIVWDIRVIKSGVPDASPGSDFDKYFASSGFSRVYQLEEVDAAISDTDVIYR